MSTCSWCGWDWDADDETNRKALDERLTGEIQSLMDAHPDWDWSREGLRKSLYGDEPEPEA